MSQQVQMQVFYEIAMELAPEADLQNTAKRGLSAYLHKLGCMGGVVLRADLTPGAERLVPVAAIPRNLLRDPIYLDKQEEFRETVKRKGFKAVLDSMPISGVVAETGRYYMMQLKDFGAILLIKDGAPFERGILHNIARLNEKFSQVCQAGMYTDRLEATVKERTGALQAANEKLKESLANIKTLTGLLPICAGCKKIRDDKGYWNQIETYVREHSNAEFTHGLCPSCIKKYYPEYADDEEGGKGGGKAGRKK